MSKQKVAIINGPNLNLLGKREPDVYGHQTFEEYLKDVQSVYLDLEITYFQSNLEGDIVSEIQNKGFEFDAIILNAGAYSHTSIAIHDAIKAVKTPVIEVHISNIYARETFRHHSIISSVCSGLIAGFGMESYTLALDSVLT